MRRNRTRAQVAVRDDRPLFALIVSAVAVLAGLAYRLAAG